MTLLKDRRILENPIQPTGGGGGMTPAELLRLETLEDNEYKITYFATVSAATGTITKPANSTIVLDQLASGADAYVSTIVNGQPTGIFPQTAGGVLVDVSSFNTSGDYTLSGTPSAFDVAIVYVITIPAKFYSGLTTANILDLEETNVPQGSGTTNEIAYWSGIKTLGSLATATYPSLTELSYVKGLTSAVQTQLGTKEATANKDATGGYAGLTLFKINFKNVANTFTSFFTNTNTASRTYTFQDSNGTIAHTSDIPIATYHGGSLAVFSPVDASVTYFGLSTPLAPSGTDTLRQFKGVNGTVKTATIYVDPTTTLGSNEAVTYALWNVTDGVSVGDIGTISYDVRGNQAFFSGLNLATLSTKYYAYRITNPTFATNPTNCYTRCEANVF